MKCRRIMWSIKPPLLTYRRMWFKIRPEMIDGFLTVCRLRDHSIVFNCQFNRFFFCFFPTILPSIFWLLWYSITVRRGTESFINPHVCAHTNCFSKCTWIRILAQDTSTEHYDSEHILPKCFVSLLFHPSPWKRIASLSVSVTARSPYTGCKMAHHWKSSRVP